MDYTIKQGDNLTKIAKAYNTDISTLAKLNNIQNPNLIQTGATIKLPSQQPIIPTAPLATAKPVTTNVQATNLNNVNPVQLPPAPVPVLPQTQPSMSIAEQAIQDITNQQNTATQTAQQDIIGKKLQAVMGLTGEAQAKADELAKQGYQQKLQDYQNINSQILQKQAELNKSDIQLVSDMRAQETRDTLLPFAQMGQAKLQGDATIARALKNAEIGVLNAQVIAKQGDIQLAQQTAQDAVDLKYAPFKEQIKQYDMLLETIQPLLTADEKKQAATQQIKSQVAMKQIDALADFQKNALSNAISNNAPQSVLNKINSAKSIADITAVGGNYLVSKADKLDQQLKQAQINKLYTESTTNGKLSVDEKKTAKATESLVSLLNTYKDSITGLNFFSANTPANRTKLNSLKGQITAEYKQAKQLGTLDNGVQALVDKIIPDPGNFGISSLNNDAQVKAISDFTNSFSNGTPVNSYLDTVTKVTSNGNSISDYLNSLPK